MAESVSSHPRFSTPSYCITFRNSLRSPNEPVYLFLTSYIEHSSDSIIRHVGHVMLNKNRTDRFYWGISYSRQCASEIGASSSPTSLQIHRKEQCSIESKSSALSLSLNTCIPTLIRRVALKCTYCFHLTFSFRESGYHSDLYRLSLSRLYVQILHFTSLSSLLPLPPVLVPLPLVCLILWVLGLFEALYPCNF